MQTKLEKNTRPFEFQNRPQAITNTVPLEEVTANFMALLEDTDFSVELHFFNIGMFSRALKRVVLHEFTCIYIGLWALALKNSFPSQYDEIFSYFMQQYAQKLPASSKKQILEKVWAYKNMILSNSSNDFSYLSRHLLSFTKTNETTFKADILRLSLTLRNYYTFIFQRLV